VGVGVGVGVILGSGVGRGLVWRMIGVGVGCFGSGITVNTRLRAMLKTTTRPSILKMICCPLLCERLTFTPPM
jgi:hypothetical protein